jgi:3-oxoadipate enol-lactonase
MSFARSHGVDIYYERHGAGPAVVFCHGAGSNAATWWQQIPAFAARFTCLTFDCRGFGRSVIADEGMFDPTRFVDDAMAILDAENIASAAFIGQSMGGVIGLRAALNHPQRVWAFVSTDSPLAVAHDALLGDVNRFLDNLDAAKIEERALGRTFRETHPAQAFVYSQINHFNPAVSSPQFTRQQRTDRMRRLFADDVMLPLSSLSRLRCPVLYVVGSEDPVVTSAATRDFARETPQARYLEIENAGHSAYFECPETFNRAVLAFLDEVVPPAA